MLTLEEEQHPGVVLHELDALACSSPRGADRSEPDDVVVVAGHPCNGLQEFRQQLRPLGLPHSHRVVFNYLLSGPEFTNYRALPFSYQTPKDPVHIYMRHAILG